MSIEKRPIRRNTGVYRSDMNPNVRRHGQLGFPEEAKEIKYVKPSVISGSLIFRKDSYQI